MYFSVLPPFSAGGFSSFSSFFLSLSASSLFSSVLTTATSCLGFSSGSFGFGFDYSYSFLRANSRSSLSCSFSFFFFSAS